MSRRASELTSDGPATVTGRAWPSAVALRDLGAEPRERPRDAPVHDRGGEPEQQQPGEDDRQLAAIELAGGGERLRAVGAGVDAPAAPATFAFAYRRASPSTSRSAAKRVDASGLPIQSLGPDRAGQDALPARVGEQELQPARAAVALAQAEADGVEVERREHEAELRHRGGGEHDLLAGARVGGGREQQRLLQRPLEPGAPPYPRSRTRLSDEHATAPSVLTRSRCPVVYASVPPNVSPHSFGCAKAVATPGLPPRRRRSAAAP